MHYVLSVVSKNSSTYTRSSRFFLLCYLLGFHFSFAFHIKVYELFWVNSRKRCDFFLFCLFIYLDVVGLCYCSQAFSVFCNMWTAHCGAFSCCRSPVLGCPGFSSCDTWNLEHGLSGSWHVVSSQITAWTRVPCIGRWILNPRTTREVPPTLFFFFACLCLIVPSPFVEGDYLRSIILPSLLCQRSTDYAASVFLILIHQWNFLN